MASSLAIVIGVGFVAATLVLSATVKSSVDQAVAAGVGDTAVVVSSGSRALTDETVRRVRDVPGTGEVQVIRRATLRLTQATSAVRARTMPPASAVDVAMGRLPRTGDEAAVSTTAHGALHTDVGNVLRVQLPDGNTVDVHVVGVIDATHLGPVLGTAPTVFGTNAGMRQWAPESQPIQLRLAGAAGSSHSELQNAVAVAVGDGVAVRTGAQQADYVVKQYSGGTNVLTMVLLGFAAVALFVAAIVIANTFTILLAQRTREMALLRCVGATRRQVFAAVVVESAVVGVGASLVGVAAGVGLAAVVSTVAAQADLAMPIGDLTVSGSALLVPFVVGVGVTMAAAFAPARRSTRVAPLAALRPVLLGRPGRPRIRRLLVAGGCFLVGTAVLLLATQAAQVLLGIAGGMLSFLGVLMAGSVVVPVAVRLIGAGPARLSPVAAKLAVSNAVRNPTRASATCAALLVGVTLITLMSVGAATATAAGDRKIAREFPVDVTVSASGRAVPDPVIHGLSEVEGVQSSVVLAGTSVTVTGHRGQHLTGVPASDARGVLRAPELIEGLRDGVLLVGQDKAAELDLRNGASVRVRAAAGAEQLQVVVTDLHLGLLVTADDLQALAPHSGVHAVWLRTVDDTDLGQLLGDVTTITGGIDGLQVSGAASLREQMHALIDILLLVVTGLLGVAVLIAVIGIANTLSLSVLERGRESALLRALGLTRRQLGSMLSLEALLVAAVGSVLGVVLGTFYGWAAAQCLVGSIADVGLVIPWGRVVGVVAVAVLAGLVASLVPARRAARIAPAAGLTLE